MTTLIGVLQARVLNALKPEGGEAIILSRTELAKKAGFSPTAGTIYRALRGIPPGSSTGPPEDGLIQLGLVIKHDANDVSLATYQITTAGIAAINSYLAEQSLPALRDRESSINLRYTRNDGDPVSSVYPDEVEPGDTYREGTTKQVIVNAYERNLVARRACITHYGATCVICGFNFASTYGSVVEGLIHVHHLKPLSQIRTEYAVDPIADLRPVCPNCHAVLHSRVPAYSIQDVVDFLREAEDEERPVGDTP